MVQRWPAVPTAEKVMARWARSSLADGATIIALLPPSSRMVLPKRAATTGASSRPMRVEPVAETTRDARILRQRLAGLARAEHDLAKDAPRLAEAMQRAFDRVWTASAVSGVFWLGFQMTGLPQTTASAAFHDHTATGN